MSRYKQFSLSEFKTDVVYKDIWKEVSEPQHQEYIYEMQLNNSCYIKIFSSIHKSDDITRDCGEDAVRIIAFDKHYNPINKKTVYRTKNCFNNIKKAVTTFYKQLYNSKICYKCQGILVPRKNKQGIEFLGCSNFFNH